MPVEILPYLMADPRWANPRQALPPDVQREIATDFAPPDGCLLVAFDSETAHHIIGCAGFRKLDQEECEVKRVVVMWDYQQAGVGPQLMNQLQDEARRVGYRRMRAAVPVTVPALVRFYESMNFQKAQPLSGYCQSGLAHFELVL